MALSESNTPLHLCSYIKIERDGWDVVDGENVPKIPRILKRSITDKVLSYDFNLARTGGEGFSENSDLLDKIEDIYDLGVVRDLTNIEIDHNCDGGFDFLRFNSNGFYYYLLTIELLEDEHNIIFYEEVPGGDPKIIYEYIVEDEDPNYLPSRKVIKFLSSDKSDPTNIVINKDFLENDEETKLINGIDLLYRNQVATKLGLHNQSKLANQFKFDESNLVNTSNRTNLSRKSIDSIVVEALDEFIFGTNYKKGTKVNFNGLRFKSLIDNNVYHPFQKGTWIKIN